MADLQSLMSADTSAFLASQESAVLQSAAPVQPEVPASVVAVPQAGAEQLPATPTEAQPATGQAVDSNLAPAVAEAQDDDFDIDDLVKDPPAATEEAAAEAVDQALDQQGKTAAELDDEVGRTLATPRGKRIYAEYQKSRELAKPEEDGGIGHAPTADQVKEYYRAFVEAQSLANDFQSGTPEGIARWAHRHFAPENGQLAQYAARTLMTTLAQQNPDAYIAAAQTAVERYASAAIPRFLEAMEQTQASIATAPDSEKFQLETRAQGLWVALQELHKDAFGSYYDPQTGGAQQASQPHPAEVELRRLRQEQAARQNTERTTQYRAVMQEIDATFNGALDAAVERALAPVKGNVPPVMYRGIKTDYLNRVREAVGKNQQGLALLNQHKDAVARQQARQNIPSLTQRYLQMALEPLKAYRAEYLNAAGREAKSASDTRHAQLQQSASRTEPQSAAAAPSQRDLAPAIVRQPGETQESFMRRMIGVVPA